VGDPVSATIATGVITATASRVAVDTEGGAASDSLDTVNGGADGDFLILSAVNGVSRTVTVKNGTGNIFLASDRLLNSTRDRVVLLRYASGWIEIAYSAT
jgi:hypothetical protein